MDKKQQLRIKRHTKIRHRVSGTADRPRLSLYRGLRHLYAQLIDDVAGKTIFGLSDKTVIEKGTGMERAEALGKELAKRAQDKKITTIVFDRSGFRYHGQIKKVADTLRDAGITV